MSTLVETIAGARAGWVWERTVDGAARFVLGTLGENPLVCFGINPSTAVPGALDKTVNRVRGFAADNGHDSWTMLNVYPQITPFPKELHQHHSAELKAENEHRIATIIDGRPLTLLAAWGGTVTKRKYLPALLRDIVSITNAAGCRWVSLGDALAGGHPPHPLYLAGTTPLQEFDMDEYLGLNLRS